MADEETATESWTDELFGDAPVVASDLYEPVVWPEALDWPPAPAPLAAEDFRDEPAPPGAAPVEPLEPVDFGAAPDRDATAAVPMASVLGPDDPDLIPDSIWGPSPGPPDPQDLAPPEPIVFGDSPGPAGGGGGGGFDDVPPPPEDLSFALEPLPDSVWAPEPDDRARRRAPGRAPAPAVYAEPEGRGPGHRNGWFQVRHPTAAMAGLAVFVALVIVGLVLSVRSRPDATPTDAAQRGGTIAAQRLPTTTSLSTTTTATTTPSAVIDLQPPATDGAAAPADAGSTPAAGGATPARTTPTTRATTAGGSGGGGSATPPQTTGTTGTPQADPGTTTPATSPPPDPGTTTPATSIPRRNTTVPVDVTFPPVTAPPTTQPTTGTSFTVPSIPFPSIPGR